MEVAGATVRRGSLVCGRAEVVLALAPSALVLLTFVAFPLMYSFYLSFHRWSPLLPQRTFLGLDNYRLALAAPEFWLALKNTVAYTGSTVLLGGSLGLALAVALHTRLAGRGLLRAGLFLPVLCSSVAAALVWQWMFDPYDGLVNRLLAVVGVPGPLWLADPAWSLAAVILMSAWKDAGYDMIIYQQAFEFFRMGYASAVVWLIAPALGVLGFLQLRRLDRATPLRLD